MYIEGSPQYGYVVVQGRRHEVRVGCDTVDDVRETAAVAVGGTDASSPPAHWVRTKSSK